MPKTGEALEALSRHIRMICKCSALSIWSSFPNFWGFFLEVLYKVCKPSVVGFLTIMKYSCTWNVYLSLLNLMFTLSSLKHRIGVELNKENRKGKKKTSLILINKNRPRDNSLNQVKSSPSPVKMVLHPPYSPDSAPGDFVFSQMEKHGWRPPWRRGRG